MTQHEAIEEEVPGGFHEAEIPEVIDQISLEQEQQDREYLKKIIEAVLFASPNPLPFNKIRDLIQSIEPLKNKEIKDLINDLAKDYEDQNRAFVLEEIADGYVLRTRPQFSPYLDQVFRNKKVERLSHSATEVLAIIAYRQPITRPQIEEIRGVDSSGVVASLVERELIHVVGKLEAPGRPALYGTTKRFLEHYGLKDVKDLPTLGIAERPLDEMIQEEKVETENTDTGIHQAEIIDDDSEKTDQQDSNEPAEELACVSAESSESDEISSNV